MALSQSTTDVWRTPRRVFDNSGRFTMQSPRERYGDFNPAGFGDWNRAQAIAAEVRLLDYATWVDVGLRQLQHLFRAPDMNAAFFEALKPFEMRLEDALRVSLGGVAIYAQPAAPFVPASAPGPETTPEIRQQINSIIGGLEFYGARFQVDLTTKEASYFLRFPGQMSPDERGLLLDHFYATREIIEARQEHRGPLLPGGRVMLPNYPQVEPEVGPNLEENSAPPEPVTKTEKPRAHQVEVAE